MLLGTNLCGEFSQLCLLNTFVVFSFEVSKLSTVSTHKGVSKSVQSIFLLFCSLPEDQVPYPKSLSFSLSFDLPHSKEIFCLFGSLGSSASIQ